MKEDPQEIGRRIHESTAHKNVMGIEILGTNFYVFSQNYVELVKLLEINEDPKKIHILWDIKNRQYLQLALKETLRLLHNFLASSASLADQTSVSIRSWYKDNPFLEIYNREIISRFVSSPITSFIMELRNYNLHYSLPVTNATFRISLDEDSGKHVVDHSFVLVKNSLLAWDSWTKTAKQFLDSAESQINISTLVNDYYKYEYDFYQWLLQRLKELHKEDIAWVEEMRKQMLSNMTDEEKKDRGLL